MLSLNWALLSFLCSRDLWICYLCWNLVNFVMRQWLGCCANPCFYAQFQTKSMKKYFWLFFLWNLYPPFTLSCYGVYPNVTSLTLTLYLEFDAHILTMLKEKSPFSSFFFPKKFPSISYKILQIVTSYVDAYWLKKGRGRPLLDEG